MRRDAGLPRLKQINVARHLFSCLQPTQINQNKHILDSKCVGLVEMALYLNIGGFPKIRIVWPLTSFANSVMRVGATGHGQMISLLHGQYSLL
jgi:hypothetical protein